MPVVDKPSSYLEWIRVTDITNIPSSRLFAEYNEYLLEWYKEKRKDSAQFTSFRTQLFHDLLSEIIVNYTTEDEKRFLSKIDLENASELDIAIPFFVKRLKEISQYLIKKRQEVKTIKQKHTSKGSEQGVAYDIRSTIVNYLNDENFIKRYPTTSIPNINEIADFIYVEIEPLIDEYGSYFDVDSKVDISKYVQYDDKFKSNHKTSVQKTDKNYWIDLAQSIQELINKTSPALMELNNELDDPRIANTAGFLDIELNYQRTDISNLPSNQFVNFEKEQDNLNIVYEKKLIEKYAGSKMMYLSTGTSTSTQVSGVLFDPINKSANYLNRYNSVHAGIPTVGFHRSEKDIGKFFLPHKLGLLNFDRVTSYIELDKTRLQPSTCYVYPDPTLYETGRGSTLVDRYSIYRYIDDNTAVKGNNSNPYIEGEITNSKKVQKHYPYQSVEESQQLQGIGISRWSDDVDFWEGDKKDVWADKEIFKKLPLQNFPIQDKQDDLLVSDRNVQKWTTDIYGNEFGLFKVVRPTRKTTSQINESYTADPVRGSLDTSVPETTAEFSYPSTKYFPYQLSGSCSEFESTFNSLTSELTISDSNTLATTHLYFRNAKSTVVAPASSALSAVFVKYNKDTAIINEIHNNIVDFEIINDIVVIQTTNYIVIEKYTYDFDLDTFTSILPFKVLVSRGPNTDYEKLIPYWYDEDEKNIYIGKTTLHPYLSSTNFKSIYPEIYVYNDRNITFHETYSLNTLVPAISTVDYLDTHKQEAYNVLLSAGYVISSPYVSQSVLSGYTPNIVKIETPKISVNSNENTLSLNMIGIDISDVRYVYNWYFDTRDFTLLTAKQLDLFAPNGNVGSLNLGQYNTVVTEWGMPISSVFESETFQRGSLESKLFTLESFKNKLIIDGDESLITYPLTFNGVSGRDINPAGHKDLTRGVIRMGAGLSASASDAYSNNSTEVADTDILPYSHNNSCLLLNPSLSASTHDVVITFDVAMYTLTDEYSAYAQIAS